ncbi:hypothetical protein D3C81_2339070 [compost metagenome]
MPLPGKSAAKVVVVTSVARAVANRVVCRIVVIPDCGDGARGGTNAAARLI